MRDREQRVNTPGRDKPNIILIMTDQQRYDTIRALGFPHVKTPTLDRLVQEGVSFAQCYCAAPSCVPSRASFFNALYAHTLGVFQNYDPWDQTWVEQFQAAGYHTVNVGNMHTVPLDAPAGFDQRLIVENKARLLRLNQPHGAPYDEWDKFLHNLGMRKPSREVYRDEHPHYATALGAFDWPLAEEYHPDVFVARMARWFIEERQFQNPFFLMLGFPGPHPPYDPPRRVLQEYAGVDLPLPEVGTEELARQPPCHAVLRREMVVGNHDAIQWSEAPSREQLLLLRRHYAANVTLIDELIGQVLETLEQRGLLDNAIVIFTSDHGDCLGDHGLIQKWVMHDCIVRVPMVIWAPGRLPRGKRVEALVQQMDIVPMLFHLAGLEYCGKTPAMDALPLALGEGSGREAVFAEQAADNVFKGTRFATMVRTADWKLVHYLGEEWGELYDLRRDPGEVRNLWNEADYADVKREMLHRLLDWRIRDSLQR